MSGNAYFELLRVNHWFKNLFVYFGWFMALYVFRPESYALTFLMATLAVLLASLISSSNYIINQITDIEFDRKHPDKKNRPLPSGKLSTAKAVLLSLVLFAFSLMIGYFFYGVNFLISITALWLAGIIYNVRPVRAKDIPIVDVIVESSNNPIRFLIGWFSVATNQFPSAFLLLLTLSGAAVLMTGKRYDELTYYGKKLYPYRRTFEFYNVSILKSAIYIYSFFSVLFFSLVILSLTTKLIVTIPIFVAVLVVLINNIITGKARARFIEDYFLSKSFLTIAAISSILVFIVIILVIYES